MTENLHTSKWKLIPGLIFAFTSLPALILLVLNGHIGSLGFEIGCWAIAFILVLYTIFVEKQSFKSLGFQPFSFKTLLFGFSLGAILFFLFLLSNTIVEMMGFSGTIERIKTIGELPVLSLIMLALRASVTEEVIFRSYPIERLLQLRDSKTLAALIPLLFFVLTHFSWGFGHLLFVTLGGGIFTIVYLWKRNIWINIIGHFTVDLTVLLLIPHMGF